MRMLLMRSKRRVPETIILQLSNVQFNKTGLIASIMKHILIEKNGPDGTQGKQ